MSQKKQWYKHPYFIVIASCFAIAILFYLLGPPPIPVILLVILVAFALFFSYSRGADERYQEKWRTWAISCGYDPSLRSSLELDEPSRDQMARLLKPLDFGKYSSHLRMKGSRNGRQLCIFHVTWETGISITRQYHSQEYLMLKADARTDPNPPKLSVVEKEALLAEKRLNFAAGYPSFLFWRKHRDFHLNTIEADIDTAMKVADIEDFNRKLGRKKSM